MAGPIPPDRWPVFRPRGESPQGTSTKRDFCMFGPCLSNHAFRCGTAYLLAVFAAVTANK